VLFKSKDNTFIGTFSNNQVVEAVSKKGFKTDEIQIIGAIYRRIEKFVLDI
jgi:hypothetical protein